MSGGADSAALRSVDTPVLAESAVTPAPDAPLPPPRRQAHTRASMAPGVPFVRLARNPSPRRHRTCCW